MAYTTIDDPSAHFQTLAYRGNSTSTTTSDRSLTNEGNSDLQPDLVWIANRDTAINSGMRWWDSSRGVGQNLGLTSSGTNAEGSPNDPEYGYVNSLNTNGFGVRAGSNDSNGRWTVDRGEGGGDKYVAWQWKANAGSTSSNTSGTLTSTIQSDTTAGFCIATYTGNGTQGATYGHNLGVAPDIMFTKNRTSSGTSWSVDGSIGDMVFGTNRLILDTNVALGADTNNVIGASSTLITVGNGANCNQNTSSHVAYLFAEKQGYSKFGSYIGNGNANGTFVYTGFKPSFVMIKRSDSLANWVILDNKRDAYNQATEALRPDLTDATLNSTDHATDFLSNGFKFRGTGTRVNGSSATYIYMAFAENPFVTSTGIPTTAR